jgi:hypothetical protein
MMETMAAASLALHGDGSYMGATMGVVGVVVIILICLFIAFASRS